MIQEAAVFSRLLRQRQLSLRQQHLLQRPDWDSRAHKLMELDQTHPSCLLASAALVKHQRRPLQAFSPHQQQLRPREMPFPACLRPKRRLSQARLKIKARPLPPLHLSARATLSPAAQRLLSPFRHSRRRSRSHLHSPRNSRRRQGLVNHLVPGRARQAKLHNLKQSLLCHLNPQQHLRRHQTRLHNQQLPSRRRVALLLRRDDSQRWTQNPSGHHRCRTPSLQATRQVLTAVTYNLQVNLLSHRLLHSANRTQLHLPRRVQIHQHRNLTRSSHGLRRSSWKTLRLATSSSTWSSACVD